jgi:hypothetical protein
MPSKPPMSSYTFTSQVEMRQNYAEFTDLWVGGLEQKREGTILANQFES